MWRRLACLLLIAGCPDVTTDPGETAGQLPTTDGPTVEFDPMHFVIPVPDDLDIDPATHRVSMPTPFCENPTLGELRTGALDQLDGFGTYEPAITVTFTAPVDPGTLAGRIVMYQRTQGQGGNDPRTATQVPITLSIGTTTRYDSQCNAAMIETVTFVPEAPLDETSTYTLAVLAGVATTGGVPFLPSPTWALVRQPDDPVTVDAQGDILANNTPLTDPVQIRELDTWWKAEATGLAFLDATGAIADRSQVLVAWELTTQTTTDPLDPSIAGSVASALSTDPLANLATRVDSTVEATLEAMLVANSFATADTAAATCAAIHCDAIGDVLGAELQTVNYQTHVANPRDGGSDWPGPWSDPLDPAPQPGFAPALDVLVIIPATPPPAAGYPVVIFGHDLGSEKESLLWIAGVLAAQGVASIAIDFPYSGSRAVVLGEGIPLDGSDACNGATYETAPACFVPFPQGDPPTLRDTVRQGVLDLERLVRAVKASAPSLAVDRARISYLGFSFGGVIGGPFASVEPDLASAVFAVPAVGWLDVFEQTASYALKCPFVDALIDDGLLSGTSWDGASHGLCTQASWVAQATYQSFAADARWLVDPADGANFAARLAGKRVLVQEVVGDEVMPNAATDREGALAGLVAGPADVVSPVAPLQPSAALAGSGSRWLRYQAVAAGDPSDAWGIAYRHASLLEPAPSGSGACAQAPATACTDDTACGSGDICVFAGELGTARMQADAVYFMEATP